MAKGAIVESEALKSRTVSIRFMNGQCTKATHPGKKSSMSWTAKMIKGTEDAEAGWRLRINEESSLPISITL
jgi:hypothetical protein